MLARRAGLLDWDRNSIKWAVVAVVTALLIGVLAQRTVSQNMQAADPAGATAVRPA